MQVIRGDPDWRLTARQHHEAYSGRNALLHELPLNTECQMSFELSPRCTMCNCPLNAASAGETLLFWFGILTFVLHALPSNTECQMSFELSPRCTMCNCPFNAANAGEALLF